MVRNTSSILAILAFAKSLSASKKQDICFAFIDGATHSSFGHQMLLSYLAECTRKKLVYLDAVGNPGDLQVFSKKPTAVSLKDVNWHACSESMNITADYFITVGTYLKGAVKIPNANTRKDSELDEKALMSVVRLLKQLTNDLLKTKHAS